MEHFSFSLLYRKVPLVIYGVITWPEGDHPAFEADRVETATGQENLYWLLDEGSLSRINSAGRQKYLDEAAEFAREQVSMHGRSCHA